MVKEKIRVESMFRYDHFFRSRTESELNKRMQSIYKLIEKEKDNEEYGLDNEKMKEYKKKMKKKKNIEEMPEKMEDEDKEDEMQGRAKYKHKKEKQTSLNKYVKRSEEAEGAEQ